MQQNLPHLFKELANNNIKNLPTPTNQHQINLFLIGNGHYHIVGLLSVQSYVFGSDG